MRSLVTLVLRRIAVAIPMLLAVATVTFLLMQLVPGSPAAAILGTNATPEQYERIENKLGLNDSLIQQYGRFMSNLVRGDLGKSWVGGQSVTELVTSRLPVTLSLAVLATGIALVVGILIGSFSAIKGGTADRAMTSASGLGLAVPSFWLAGVLVLLFSVQLGWLPATGYVAFADGPSAWLQHMILPVAALALVQIATIARQTRSEMIRVLDQDFIRTLRATGIPRRSVIWKHGLRNASIPVVTVLGLQFVAVFGGAVIIERVFALPGVGSLTLDAATSNDAPVVIGVVVITAAMVLLVNLVIDVAYWVLQPRIRFAS